MFAGHIGAALVVGRAERRINLGALVLAALLLDVLLWFFILVGLESVVIPADFARTHQPAFDFPWSHGLVASLVWSAGAFGAAWIASGADRRLRLRVSGLVAVAVFSHWVLDFLVHAPELPLLGDSSPKLGLGLWQSMPVALAVESALVVLGLVLYLPRAGLSRARSVALAALTLATLGFTIAGMTVAPPPPSPQAMAGSSLVTIALTAALIAWLDRRARN
ncbi:MAG: hypothetical protein H6746_05030 [Deltaproteobacteria bacterium]|nr:hypothetical protein [Deltaproteobacteria bacterium]